MKAPDVSKLPGSQILVGMDGNAFSVIVNTKSALRKAGADNEYATDVMMRMMAAPDYDHLLMIAIAELDGERSYDFS